MFRTQIQNLNVKTTIDNPSKDIKVTLKFNGKNFIILEYSKGILSFNMDNATFWNFEIHQRELIDRLIEMFNLAPLDIILMF